MEFKRKKILCLAQFFILFFNKFQHLSLLWRKDLVGRWKDYRALKDIVVRFSFIQKTARRFQKHEIPEQVFWGTYLDLWRRTMVYKQTLIYVNSASFLILCFQDMKDMCFSRPSERHWVGNHIVLNRWERFPERKAR